jgi:DNA-binding response OmpR family regulator
MKPQEANSRDELRTKPITSLNILLAEDEHSVAFSISFALKADGHRIEIATDGEQALSKLTADSGAFDLLITDNNMPRLPGIELVRRLRETRFSGKILVLSAHLSPENRAAYGALGVHGMVPKPFDLHQLRTVVRGLAGDVAVLLPSEFQLSRTEVRRLLELGLPESEEFDELVGGS